MRNASSVQWKFSTWPASYAALMTPQERKPALCLIPIALIPGNRAALITHRRARREMLELGLINEVRALREEYELNASLPSMRCVGYRQTWQYLDGEFGLGMLRDKAVAATRQLAKRQLTWLRAMQGLNTFDCLAEDLHEQVGTWLKRNLHAPMP